MRHARQLHVADIEPAPLHQPIEIRPRHRLADIGIRPVEHRKRFGLCRRSTSWRASGARPRRRSRPRRRWPDSRCSGSSCRKDARGSARGPASAIASADPAPPSALPGVQKPHCSALRSRNAACRSAISPLSDNPSMVSTDALCACTASIRQERTISPLTRTVHAPHTPCSQPTCVPVSFRCSRRKSARLSRGSTCASTRSPLTSSEMATAAVTPMLPRGDRGEQAAWIRNAPAAPSPDAGAWRVSPADPPADRVLQPMREAPRTTRAGVTATSISLPAAPASNGRSPTAKKPRRRSANRPSLMTACAARPTMA